MNGVLGKSTGKNLTNYEKPRHKDLHYRVHTPDTTILGDIASMKNRNLDHKDHWETPKYFYEMLNREFLFNFDPCPLDADFDGLIIAWGKRNFINPPYSQKLKEAFINKALQESKKGKLCVMLLPVSTSTKIFHEVIQPNAEIRFIKGRIKFKGVNAKGKYVTDESGMHDSMVVVFRTDYNNQLKIF